jgi:elongation factor P
MAEVIHAKDLRAGNAFLWNDNIYLVLENTFNKTAMGKGIVKCKLKNLRTGTITWEALTGEKFEKAELTSSPMSFSYVDNGNYIFMDDATYETIEIPESKLQWEKNFISDGVTIRVQKYGDEILGIAMPDQVTVTLAEAEDAVAGNTATSAQKKAWLANKFEIQVPQFIKTGEKIIINTADGSYVGRAKE